MIVPTNNPQTGEGVLRRCSAFGWRRLASLVLVVFLAACASRDSAPYLAYDQGSTQRLFSVGYEDISTIYIDEVAISDLALSGLQSLGSIDPAISVVEEGRSLKLLFEGAEASRLPLPPEGDTERWGGLTAEFISSSRDASPELANAKSEEIYEAVFDGILGQLDGFSRYAGRDLARENRASRDGFGGIGVRIRLVEEGVLILSVMEDTPAERGGMLKNDIIIAVDGEPVAGLTQREAVSRLRGTVRSPVLLTVERDSADEPVDLTIVRAHIIPQTTSYKALGKAAYIRVSGFNQNTTRSLRERVEQADEDLGEDLTGFIIDLRNNPGGLLDQSVSVSDLFMQGGRIVTTRGRHPDSHQYFEANNQDITKGRPIVVLTNAGSASASEIVAAALQDSGRAVVIGSVTFGKGTVQTLLRLPNQGELTLTWARFHAPSGYALNKRGILPDICTSLHEAAEGDEGDDGAENAEDAQSVTIEEVLTSIRSGSGLTDHRLRSLDVPQSDDQALESLRATCPANDNDPDIDLEIAGRLLEEPGLYALALHGSPNTANLQSTHLTR